MEGVDNEYIDVEDDILNLYSRLSQQLGIRFSPCHNDLVAENFVVGINKSQEKLYLIDWEYSGLNDPMWDLASLFEESMFPKEIEDQFLVNYHNLIVQSTVVEPLYILKEKVHIYKILQNALWYLWTLAKESKGDFFGNYKYRRLERALFLYSKYKEIYS